MANINLEISTEDCAIIERILDRADKFGAHVFTEENCDKQSSEMDLIACHLNGCPLKLQEFLDADDFNFAHDFFGIRHHMNRQTGTLERFFLPRFYDSAAAKEQGHAD